MQLVQTIYFCTNPMNRRFSTLLKVLLGASKKSILRIFVGIETIIQLLNGSPLYQLFSVYNTVAEKNICSIKK